MTNNRNIAFIIGNGPSGKNFNLNLLMGHGTIFGCNALYRDFGPMYRLPHYLVAIDEPIIAEILKSDWPQNRFIIPPEDERWEPSACNLARPRSNAGMNAMREAIKHGHDFVYCLGFDFLIDDPEISTDNIYKDTECYGADTHASFEASKNRVRYMEWVALNNPLVHFCFVFPRDMGVNFQALSAPNVNGTFYDIIEENILTLNAR